jgi:hypothetical protein
LSWRSAGEGDHHNLVIFADVIFPVFTIPYFTSLFMPWLLIPALVAEAVIFKCFYPGYFWGRIVTTVLGANTGSWMLGILAGLFLLPSGLRQHTDSPLIDFAPKMVILAFIFAFVLSVIVEGGIWWVARKDLRSRRLLLATLLANIVSYAVLIGGALLIGGPDFFSH